MTFDHDGEDRDPWPDAMHGHRYADEGEAEAKADEEAKAEAEAGQYIRRMRARIKATKTSWPIKQAHELVTQAFMQNVLCTLVRYREDFLAWGMSGASYTVLPEADLRALVYQMLAERNPDRNDVSNVIDALRAITAIDSEPNAPTWLRRVPGFSHEPNDCLIARNTIVHLSSGQTHPATPVLFATAAIPTRYDVNAPQPSAWLKFLKSVWPSDQDVIDTLQEIMGYLLTTDTNQQKAFLIIGPKRSGKGTIARVLKAMIGNSNVAGPTLNSLATNFGLQPLIGKQAAIVSDARLSGKADQSAITERILSISDEDVLTIDRKYKEAWTGALSSRFIIMTNELPRLADASGALLSRFILLTMKNSFYGSEDTRLSQRLMSELPGILQWSIAGLHRPNQRGHSCSLPHPRMPWRNWRRSLRQSNRSSKMSALLMQRGRLLRMICMLAGAYGANARAANTRAQAARSAAT